MAYQFRNHRAALWSVLPLLLVLSEGAQGQPGTGESSRGHFHHVHLKVTNAEATQKFYEKVFGASPVQFRNVSPALYTERSFILLETVEQTALSNLKTAIWHIGWGGVDGPSEYAWWKKEGVDFHTPLTPVGSHHYMYLYGPDREVLEIYSGEGHHRFSHIHLLAAKPQETAQWFRKALDLPPDEQQRSVVFVDNVNILVFPNSDRFRPKEQGPTVLPTEESTLDHLAFSFRDLDAAFKRMKEQQFEIVRPVAVSEEYKIRSFFARAPDRILVEFLEAKPIPEGLWDR